ncbi:MAG: glycoside hydrolase family 99-like domain-containing protein, partial [Verrucomicrobia bacterium]|nr:glycoside hydrolase family 99-like domain-containing protein [Verrucomicrobiota bacterium]
IRWDAWQEGGGIQAAVEKSLGPNRWHYRLPFFAQVAGSNSVAINGNSQAIMDQEIYYAANAGIDYWAFVIYDSVHPNISLANALKLYLSSTSKSRINFASIISGTHITNASTAWNAQVTYHVNHFGDPSYQKVLGNRPLFYIFGGFPAGSVAIGRAAIAQLRTATTNAGLGNPYIVYQGFNAASDYTVLTDYGFDALGAYARPDGTGTGKSYMAHATNVHNFWESDKATGANVVPIVSSGWDNRPRFENPVPWTTGSTNYVLPPTPDELTNHINDALNWTRSNLTNATPANTILIYAWNEHDEGGWICPTLKTNALANAPDTTRLDAIGTVTGMLNANQNRWVTPGTGITILVNQPPTAGNITYTRSSGSSLNVSVADVLTHVTNVSAGQTLSLVGVGGGNQGATIILAGAVIQYFPAVGNTNSDGFTYTVSDGRGGTATGNITMNVN